MSRAAESDVSCAVAVLRRRFVPFRAGMLEIEKHLFANLSGETSTCAVKRARQGRELQSQTAERPSVCVCVAVIVAACTAAIVSRRLTAG